MVKDQEQTVVFSSVFLGLCSLLHRKQLLGEGFCSLLL
jgi:hypothetical protein